MKYLDLSLPTPEENLACDEALLDLCEENAGTEILRFWEPLSHFAVLGYSCRWREEIKLVAEKPVIPVFRRASGGGTVLQGPGNLNYSLILHLDRDASLQSVRASNFYIMALQQEALSKAFKKPVRIQGYTDLTWQDLKFSGNAQRRKRRTILFHGTFLLNFDLNKIEQYLPVPEKQPAYRQNRPHLSFLTNLPLEASDVKRSLREIWIVDGEAVDVPGDRIRKLVQERYADPEWIYKI